MSRMRQQITCSRAYGIPNSNQRLVLSKEVLQTFIRSRQTEGMNESGGLLFAKFNLPDINIECATTPHSTDKRWYALFVPNRIVHRLKVRKLFKQGYHYIGEWHTHPESCPSPSQLDLTSMKDAYLKSHHELNYFVMIIVGNSDESLNLWVSLHNDEETIPLKDAAAPDGRTYE